ncbi:MAG TPA: hypothetical protein GXX50_10595 [Firmicutes bacterium]|jgi:hypothetical protein|uniref:hypothetical protein n=1 Tax=Gelria sp. Kuro-4 TaxID=2796927 RepID=UPI0019C1249A|nr:hypothetical protein [Gelria sp. Kuro-4]HHV58191.1 hypothetical protein [Bacillota bacterium]
MELTSVKGLISITLSVKEHERQRLAGLSTSDLLQLSKSELSQVVQPDLVREVMVGYDGETVQMILSI